MPDQPGVAAQVFGSIAQIGANVDMIVQNVSEHGMTDLSFTTPFADLPKVRESLDGIALNAPLAAGTYQAMAVTVVTDADGENQLTTRVPVTLHVAG